MPNIY